MYSLKTISVLAFAATAFAAPMPAEDNNALAARNGWGDWSGGNGHWNRPSSDAVVTVTKTYDSQPEATSAPAKPEITTSVAPPAQPVVTVTKTGNAGWGGQTSAPAAQPTQASSNGWSSSPAAQPSTAPSVGSGGDWFDIANKWRTAGGQAAFVSDSTLIANAQKTADDSTNGLEHELNPGTFAQVLAPGDSSDFESVYVGGWLCELPDSPGLNGICDTASSGWNHAGQTGHAEILTGTYTKIGCALGSSTGVWACDLA